MNAYELIDWDGEGSQLVEFFDGETYVGTFAVSDEVRGWMNRIDAGETVHLYVTDNVLDPVLGR